MARAKFLAWIDLETTGVDPIQDPILEIGMVVTESKRPFEELTYGSWVIDPSVAGHHLWKDRLGDYVGKMHTDNGLLADISDPDIATSMVAAQEQTVLLLEGIGRPHNFMLAGSGVGHFDRAFIKQQMPVLEKWLQYPNLDVGVIRRALSFAGRSDLDAFGTTFDTDDKPHRGLNDIRDHLAEFRIYSEMFNSIEPMGAQST